MNDSEDPTISEDLAIAEETRSEDAPINLEYERLKIEEKKIRVDEKRLEIEGRKVDFERRWANRWITPFLPVLIASVFSLAGVFGGAWITHIFARGQRETELAVTNAQKQHEMNLLKAQQEREWGLEVAKFVAEHANVIFGGTREQQKHVADVIAITFPANISDALLKKLDATQPQGKNAPLNTWAQARKELKQNDVEAHVFFEVQNELDGSGIPGAHVVFTIAEGGEPLEALTDSYGRGIVDLSSGVNFRVLIQKNGYQPKNNLVTYTPGKHYAVYSLAAMPGMAQ